MIPSVQKRDYAHEKAFGLLSGGWEMRNQNLTAVIHKEGEFFVAQCPEVGTVSQGYSFEEALANLKEATELYLEEFEYERTDRSFITTFDVTLNG